MDAIRQYIVSVAAAAILCGILRELLPGKSAVASLLKLVSGIFLAFVVISPVRNLEMTNLGLYMDSFSYQGEVIAASGENMRRDAMAEIIKDQTEAYILDKAQTLAASLSVEVSLSDTAIPVPQSVRIQGAVSPYARNVLERILEDDLGIAKENQSWIG